MPKTLCNHFIFFLVSETKIIANKFCIIVYLLSVATSLQTHTFVIIFIYFSRCSYGLGRPTTPLTSKSLQHSAKKKHVLTKIHYTQISISNSKPIPFQILLQLCLKPHVPPWRVLNRAKKLLKTHAFVCATLHTQIYTYMYVYLYACVCVYPLHYLFIFLFI